MAQSFGCPSCGGSLEYSGIGRTMKCPYCGTVVQVPESLWQPVEQAHAADQWKKWLVIFLVVTVGLPTCFAILGTVVGVGGGIFAAIIPFVLSFMGR